MKSLGTRLAIVISIVLLGLIAVAGLFLERSLTKSIQDEGIEQAELHAQTILGSLSTLMLNGNGTLAREWLDRLHGVAGIEDIGVLRTDGTPAFTDLSTVNAVNTFLGDSRFHREHLSQFTPSHPLPDAMFRQALSGQSASALAADGTITIAMPIQADMECLTCHGYESNLLRGVLRLSLTNNAMLHRVTDMRRAILLGALTMVLILGVALWVALKFHVLRPIETLRSALVRVSQGGAQAVELDRRDEIGELANVFNQMQISVRESQQRTRAVMDNVVDGVLTLRLDGTIEMSNPATHRLFGYGEEELLGQHVDVLIPEKFRRSSGSIIGEQGVPPVLGAPYEVTGLRHDDSTFPMEVTVSEMEVGGALYYIASVRDITTRKARTAALRYQALHDALTDLPNRTLLMDRLQQGLRKAHRTEGSMALLLMDLDRFKEVNDTLGHHVGDKLLQQVAYRLRHALRESDTVARLGGDEFSVILPDADDQQAVVTARKIIKAIEKPINVEGNELRVGASVGVAMFPQHGDSATVLMQRADVAMYLAKRRRAGVVIYDARNDQHSLRQLSITGELKQAIEKDELVMYYQPKIDLRRRCLRGVEALVRWQHPQHGLLHPDEFVPLAEQTGQIQALTMAVLERVVAEAGSSCSLNNGMRISVNLSALNLSDKGFSQRLEQMLLQNNLSSSCLNLEITETALMDDPEQAMYAMGRIRDMGLPMSIDDFGIGYSSLAYLKQLPVNEVKIDKSFGQSLLTDANSVVIVRSTIALAHELGLEVVAEGVESEDAYRLLERLGCDVVQGYYVARPMPFDELKGWLQQSPWAINDEILEGDAEQVG